MMLNIKALGLVVLGKKSFKKNIFGCHGIKSLNKFEREPSK